jgi:hypothetical protein
MTRRLLTLLVVGAIAAAPSAASAQLSTSLSIAGGLSAPMSPLKDNTDAGYNVAAGLNLGAPLIPVGVRLEVGYNSFNFKKAFLADGNVHILSGTANAVLSLGPTGASPYLIGGVGMYNRNASGTGVTSSGKTVGGVNGGAGFRFPLGVMSTFVEARYHKMLGNKADGTDYSYVPVTFGISF